MLNATIKRPATISAILMIGMALSACQKLSSTSTADAASNGVVNGQLGQAADVAPNGLAESVVLIQSDTTPNEPDPKKKMFALCTGTLIAPTVVLTAAHCVVDGPVAAGIVVGLHFTDASLKPRPANVTVYHVKSFVVNPGYQATAKSTNQTVDMAILQLAAPVPAGTRIATLAPANFNLDTLPSVMAIGYGQSDDRHSAPDEKNGAGVLRYTTFPSDKVGVLPVDPKIPVMMQNMIATQADTTSVCHGDSGGPLMAVGANGVSTNMVVGVNDMVFPNYAGQEGTDFKAAMAAGSLDGFYKQYPDASICIGGLNVFVNVSAQAAWINQTAKTLQ